MAAFAQADDAIRRAATSTGSAVDAAIATATSLPAPGTSLDRAAGEPRPSPDLATRGSQPEASAGGPEASRQEMLAALGRAFRAIPGVERFGRLRLEELDRAGPSSLKRLWRETRDDLEASYGQLTIADVIDRLSGGGSASAGPA
jgi:hypothetical protein